jgi:transcriptional regulator with GAF, ATPase, and Fis domain
MGPIDEPVLIHGPTGSGKEVVARALHVTSGRRGPFVAVNCAVLGGNPMMVEDRLFGHVKGAFTGADRASRGAFDEADGGTLFLDEIAELAVDVQSQLLRVLEEKRVRPVGTMDTHPVDVRVIAATHRSLRQMVAEGKFREDLYYRLDVLGIDVPPLSARPEDLRSIASAECEQLNVKGYALSLKTKDWQAINTYSWPGNVRELRNLLRRAAFLGITVSEVLSLADNFRHKAVPAETSPSLPLLWPTSIAEVHTLEEVGKAYVNRVLLLFEGNITRSAKALGIAPNTVRKYSREGPFHV